MGQSTLLLGIFLVIVGLLGDGVGAVLIALPNGRNNWLREWVYDHSGSIHNLREALDRLNSGSTLHWNRDEELIRAIHPVLSRELQFNENGEPNEITNVASGYRIEFGDGLRQSRTGLNQKERKLERWVDRAIERRVVYNGVVLLIIGFTFQVIGVSIQFSMMLANLLSGNAG